ncbi:MAG: glutamate-5-semialdehyde dehydrogenase [Deltaproteobacteria bacterium]|nr:MAG: glutamate-5-semialdehyde dehydrogenase [Deltaproteobacteria bacterium]
MDLDEALERSVRAQIAEAKAAARRLRAASTEEKDAALRAMARALEAGREAILAANAEDVVAAEAKGTRGALLDRLRLDEARLAAMAEGLRQIADLPDPVGRREEARTLPNGLEVARMRIPLGVIAMVYEARPNVTADAAGLCLKSGNAAVLRGGTEARRSNAAIARALRAALTEVGLPKAALTLLEETDRAAILAVIRQSDLVDLAIPRGGEGLIRFVVENARVPVVQHFKGTCHVYVDDAADLGKAHRIVINAKTQRPGVCNAMECLLVHEAIAARFLPEVGRRLAEQGVELRCDAGALAHLEGLEAAVPATDDDWGREYLDLVCAVKVVADLDEALAHVERYGSHHTEAIVTEDPEAAGRWLAEVDASCVVHNASTRFNDGAQLGLGAEMGISTTKMHAYGPMGLEELTARKFVVVGDGQIRD